MRLSDPDSESERGESQEPPLEGWRGLGSRGGVAGGGSESVGGGGKSNSASAELVFGVGRGDCGGGVCWEASLRGSWEESGPGRERAPAPGKPPWEELERAMMAGGSEAAELLPPGSVWPDLVDSRVSWPDSSDIGSGVMPDTLRDSRYAPIRAPLGKVPYLCAAFFRFLSSRAPTRRSPEFFDFFSPAPPRDLDLFSSRCLWSRTRPPMAGARLNEERAAAAANLNITLTIEAKTRTAFTKGLTVTHLSSPPRDSSSSASTSPWSPSLSAKCPLLARLTFEVGLVYSRMSMGLFRDGGLSAYVIDYQVSIDALEYLLDPIGVVSALGTTIDSVRVSAVSERAGRDFGYTHF